LVWSNEHMRLSSRLVGLVLLSILPMAIAAALYARLWTIPELNAPRTLIRVPTESDLNRDHSPRYMPCPVLKQGSQPGHATVCQVVADPAKFACKRIRLRATFEGDCLENSILAGDGCERGIVPYGPAEANSAVNAFFHKASPGQPSLWRKVDRGLHRTVRIRVEEYGHVYAMQIESVDSMQAIPIPNERRSR
jgi:hypothetical protein